MHRARGGGGHAKKVGDHCSIILDTSSLGSVSCLQIAKKEEIK